MEKTAVTPKRGQTRNSAALAVLWTLLCLAAAVAIVVAVATLAGSLTGDRTVAVRIPAEDIELSASGSALTVEEVVATLETSRGTRLVAGVGLAVEAAAAGIIGGALALVVWSARQGDPFAQPNVTRLRIAVVAAIAGLVGAMVAALGRLMATDDVGLTPMTDLSFGWPATILVFTVLSQVWSVGVALRDDAELTI